MKEQRLPRGTLKPISDKAGISKQYICDITATRKRPSREMALTLEKAAAELGKEIPALMWLYGSRAELREAVTG